MYNKTTLKGDVKHVHYSPHDDPRWRQEGRTTVDTSKGSTLATAHIHRRRSDDDCQRLRVEGLTIC